MTSERRRLHPAAIGALAISGLQQLALPIVVVAVLGDGLSLETLVRGAVYTLIGTLASMAIATVQWLTTWWAVDTDSIRLRTGVLSEKITSVPLERVQAIDTSYGPVQRLFGVVALDVQAAGGGAGGEIVLKALTEEQAEEIREAVRTQGGAVPAVGDDAATDAPALPEWRLGTRDLLVAAATSGSLGVLLPVVAFGLQFADDIVGADEAQRLLPQTVGDALALSAAVIAVAWVLSFLGTVFAFWGFTAVRDGDRLRIRRGVIERREASVPVGRVHALRVVQNPFREPFGLAQVRIETAGYAKEPATAQALIPIVRLDSALDALRPLVPGLASDFERLTPVPRRAARRYVLAPALLAAIPAPIAAALAGPDWLALALLAVPAGLLGFASYKTAGWRLDSECAIVRTRLLSRTTAIADAARLQSVDRSSTPLQRRADLATVGFALASGRSVSLEHVDRQAADEIFATLAARATECGRSGKK